MIYLIDTNILVYKADIDNPFHNIAEKVFVKALDKNEFQIAISHQSFYEYIAIVTSNRVYKPISISQAVKDVKFYLNATNVIKISYTNITILKAIELMEKYNISKQNIYDVVIVATMLENNITKIITINDKDFTKFEFLEVINPVKNQDFRIDMTVNSV